MDAMHKMEMNAMRKNNPDAYFFTHLLTLRQSQCALLFRDGLM